MLGGPAALVLATLAFTAPCTSTGCPIGTPADTLDTSTVDLAQAPTPGLALEPPELPALEDLDQARPAGLELDPRHPELDALVGTTLPPDRPAPRLFAPRATDLATPAATRRPIDEAAASPFPEEPSLAHKARAAATTPSVTAAPTADAHAAHPETTQVHGAPIDGADPQRTAIALVAGLAAIGLYHRLSKDRVLEHPTRQRILSLLDDAPGQTTGELADALDVSYRTARHHTQMLTAFDLAVAVDHEGAERWCLPGDAHDLPAPISETQRRVLELVTDAGGVHLSEVARELDMAKATAKYQLDKLTENGWITDERVGPLRRFTATDDGHARLRVDDA